MTYLIAFLLVAAAMSIATLWRLPRDGRGPQTPPASHVEDPRFRSPTQNRPTQNWPTQNTPARG